MAVVAATRLPTAIANTWYHLLLPILPDEHAEQALALRCHRSVPTGRQVAGVRVSCAVARWDFIYFLWTWVAVAVHIIRTRKCRGAELWPLV